MGGLFWLWVKVVNASLWGFQPREMALAQYTPRDVVGDLGGMKVTIPRHMAEYVEYDGDPTWGEKRKGPPPVRTHESRLKSFGFDVRYPDMAGLSSSEMRQDKKTRSLHETTWIGVGIGSGENYPGDGFMDRWARATLETAERKHWFNNYEKLPQPEYGMEVWVVKGIDPQTGRAYREHQSAKDIFIHRGENGSVRTRISCSNRPYPSGQPCSHAWSLEQEGVHAEVYVRYRRGLLPHSQDIQRKVTQVILGFKATDELPAGSFPPSPASSAPAPR